MQAGKGFTYVRLIYKFKLEGNHVVEKVITLTRNMKSIQIMA